MKVSAIIFCMIRLRAHHLLCILGWRGHGYDRAFTENLNDLTARLKMDSEIKLVEGADDVCAACPNLDDNECGANDQGERIVAGPIDRRVLDRLELKIGETRRFDQLTQLVKARIAPGELSRICNGCDWLPNGWCAEGLRAVD